MSKLGERIKNARRARRLTLSEAGEILDILPTIFNKIENGDRNLSSLTFTQLLKLSQEFNISLEELVELAAEYEAETNTLYY